MAEIKIFVSHRIDIDSELIDNPLYVPVRCGAVFDPKSSTNIAGDDTGDNISDKRMSFCEFTVQYWAWKNVDADYYGLCHYRRYLSFSEKRFPTDEFNMIHNAALLPKCKRTYGLLNTKRMRDCIQNCDVVVSEYAPVKNIPTPDGKKETVRELWDAHDNVFFEKSSIDLMFRLIAELSPEYLQSAKEYFEGAQHRGFNCYVMKRELFDRLCKFQFPIMFELERRLDTTGYTQTMLRTPAFIGEMLYGIFIYHLSTRENWRIKEVQLAFFSSTERFKSKADFFQWQIWYSVDKILRKIVDPLFPKGSERREVLKGIFFKVTKSKKRGVAVIKEQK